MTNDVRDTLPNDPGGHWIPLDCTARNGRRISTSDPRWGVVVSKRRAAPVVLDDAWANYVQSLSEWERALIEYSWEEDDPAESLLNALCRDNCVLDIVSDGGCSGRHGSFGWVLAADGNILWRANGYALGGPMSSYRAEAFGRASWLVFLRQYCSFHGIHPRCTIRNYCDNSELIKQTSFQYCDPTWYNNPLQADFDLINEIRIETRELRWRVSKLCDGVHVKGHQDKKTPIHLLDRPAALNVEADAEATKALKDLVGGANSLPMIATPHGAAWLMNGNDVVSSKEQALARYKWAELQIQEFYTKKMGLLLVSLHLISWTASRLARIKMSAAERSFHTKLGIGWVATGERQELYGKQVTACHRCGGVETQEHLFKCPNNATRQADFLVRLDDHLVRCKTHEAIRRDILQGVSEYLQEPEEPKEQRHLRKRYVKKRQSAAEQQSEIGWHRFLRGTIVTQWCVDQELATRDADPTSTVLGDSWGAKLVLWLVREARDCWLVRNHELFKPDDDEDDEFVPRHVEEVQQRVRVLYGRQNRIRENDRVIFAVPLEQRLTLEWKTLRNWVDRMERVVSILETKKKANEGLHQTDIRRFGVVRSTEEAAARAAEAATNTRIFRTMVSLFRRGGGSGGDQSDGCNLTGRRGSAALTGQVCPHNVRENRPTPKTGSGGLPQGQHDMLY
jgi:hypothetical protein